MFKSRKSKLALIVATLTAANQLFAAGFSIMEQSTVGLGRSLAGMTAEIEDPGALYFNPAVGAWHERPVVMTGFHLIDTHGYYNIDGDKSTGAKTSGGRITRPAVVPNFYAIYPIADGLTINFGLSATSGTATTYKSYWTGRYFANKTSISVLEMTPSISWKITPEVSVGVGFIAQYCDAYMSRKIDQSAFGDKDGNIRLTGDSWAYGFNAGILYVPWDCTRIGLGYRSAMKHDIDMRSRVHGNMAVLNSVGIYDHDNANTNLDLPASVNFGIQQDITEKLTLMSDISWTQWSTMEDMDVKFKRGNTTQRMPMDWDDNWRFSFGGQYKLTERWTLRSGIAYDQSPIPDKEHRYPSLPDVDRVWLSVGAGYQVNKNITIDASFMRLQFLDSKSDIRDAQGHRIAGDITGYANIYSLSMTYHF